MKRMRMGHDGGCGSAMVRTLGRINNGEVLRRKKSECRDGKAGLLLLNGDPPPAKQFSHCTGGVRSGKHVKHRIPNVDEEADETLRESAQEIALDDWGS